MTTKIAKTYIPLQNSKYIIRGKKDSGKDYICQKLIKKLLKKYQKCLFLDLDLCSPIYHKFIPPGCIGLIQLKNKKEEKQIKLIYLKFIGCFSPGDCTQEILVFINLIQQFLMQPKIKKQPLVVQSFNYYGGWGDYLLSQISMFVGMEFLISTQQNLPTLDQYINELQYQAINIQSAKIIQKHIRTFKGNDQLYLKLADYFAGVQSQFQINKLLSAIKPIILNISDTMVQLGNQQNPQQLTKYHAKIINLNYVGLLNQKQQCIGCGLIRDINFLDQSIYIIAPFGDSQKQKDQQINPEDIQTLIYNGFKNDSINLPLNWIWDQQEQQRDENSDRIYACTGAKGTKTLFRKYFVPDLS